MDLDGVYRWEVEEEQRRQVIVPLYPGTSIPLEVRWLQTRTQRQTYAVMQWYAWPQGGHPAPSRWFWLDRQAQLTGKRVPWIAVSLILPMPLFRRLSDYQALSESLAQSVQQALLREAFGE